MINKNVTLTISADNRTATLDNQINVYRGDGNICINVTLQQQVYQFGKRMTKVMLLADSDIVNVDVDVVKPLNNEFFTLDTAELVDNQFSIALDKSWVDEVDEIGTYQLQINTYDSEGNKASLPSFTLEVLPRLIDTVQPFTVGKTIGDGASRSDIEYQTVATAEELAYWKDGDVVSPERMNNQLDVIKNSEAKINTAIEEANKTLDEANNAVEETKTIQQQIASDTKAIQTQIVENNKQMVEQSTARVDEAIELCEEVFDATLRYRVVE